MRLQHRALAADGLQSVWEAPPPAPAAPEEGTERQLISTPRLLVVIWIAGIAAVGLLCLAWSTSNAISKEALRLYQIGCGRNCRLQKAAGIKRKVRLVMGMQSASPCLIGIAAP